MVLVVFRSRLRPEIGPEFSLLADRMLKRAEAMPGFVSYTTFLASDDERCSLIEFESAEQLLAWRTHPDHTEAQRIGRERYYSEYSLQICDPARESRFTL